MGGNFFHCGLRGVSGKRYPPLHIHRNVSLGGLFSKTREMGKKVSDKKVETLGREELIDRVKHLEVELWRAKQVLRRDLAETQELTKYGACLLEFCAHAANALHYLDPAIAGRYIAVCYLNLVKDLRELDRLEELEHAARDEREKLMKLIVDEQLERQRLEPSPLAQVIGRNLEIDCFECLEG